MADHYLVTLARGAAWDQARPRRGQAGWDDHAAFMDALAEEGVVVLGGPVGATGPGVWTATFGPKWLPSNHFGPENGRSLRWRWRGHPLHRPLAYYRAEGVVAAVALWLRDLQDRR